MKSFTEESELPIQDAKWLAQFIAFAPFVFQLTSCLKKFNVLETLEAHPMGLTLQELKALIKLSDYSLSVLLDGGVSAKVLKCQDDKFFNTQVGKFLLSDKITNVNMNFTKDICYEGLQHLDESLEKNIPAGLQAFGNWSTIYEGLTSLPPQAQKSWFDFDHFYSSESFPRVMPLLFQSKPKRILDIGSNTGNFAISCLQYSDTVEVTLVDHPSVLKVAKERLTSLGLVHRASFHPMNVLDHSLPFPDNHDIIWMSQFLDCFSSDDIVQILRRCRMSLNDSSEIFIMETFTDCQKFNTAQFCLDMTSLYFTCMANGNSRMYRLVDFKTFLKKAELQIKEEINYIRLSHSILKCTK